MTDVIASTTPKHVNGRWDLAPNQHFVHVITRAKQDIRSLFILEYSDYDLNKVYAIGGKDAPQEAEGVLVATYSAAQNVLSCPLPELFSKPENVLSCPLPELFSKPDFWRVLRTFNEGVRFANDENDPASDDAARYRLSCLAEQTPGLMEGRKVDLIATCADPKNRSKYGFTLGEGATKVFSSVLNLEDPESLTVLLEEVDGKLVCHKPEEFCLNDFRRLFLSFQRSITL